MDYLLKDSKETRQRMISIFNEIGGSYGIKLGPVRTRLFLLAFIGRLRKEGILTRAQNQKSEKVV